jgi:hypothetical protein
MYNSREARMNQEESNPHDRQIQRETSERNERVGDRFSIMIATRVSTVELARWPS